MSMQKLTPPQEKIQMVQAPPYSKNQVNRKKLCDLSFLKLPCKEFIMQSSCDFVIFKNSVTWKTYLVMNWCFTIPYGTYYIHPHYIRTAPKYQAKRV